MEAFELINWPLSVFVFVSLSPSFAHFFSPLLLLTATIRSITSRLVVSLDWMVVLFCNPCMQAKPKKVLPEIHVSSR